MMRAVGAGHLDVPLGGVHAIILVELDNGYRLEHGTCNSSRSTLPRPTDHSSRTVPLRVAMGTDSARDDDTQEQCGDDTRYAVEDDHGCDIMSVITHADYIKRVRTGIGAVTGASTVTAGEAGIDGRHGDDVNSLVGRIEGLL